MGATRKVIGWMFLLVSVALVNIALMHNANAGPISSYDSLDDFDFLLTLPLGGIFSNGQSQFTISTATGDGQNEGALSSVFGELSIFLHAFGSGTGASEIAGFASVDISHLAGEPNPFEIDVQILKNTQTVSAIAIPPGTASASASEEFLIPGATQLQQCPAGIDLCYTATDAVTATLRGDVSGSAFTPTAPEPATLVLLGIALAGLGFSRRAGKQ